MKKNKAIPEGYMTVGEAAKKMGVTVCTLQYYDREGLLVPSAESEGGRRLYTDKDVIELYQIRSLKHLGFSLDDIKHHLLSLDNPADVAEILAEQAAAIQKKLENMAASLQAVESLRAEVLQMQSVDFKKYADIITNLNMKNEFYWLIKHFDDQTLSHFRNQFDKENALAMMETVKQLFDAAVCLHKDGVSPESKKGQNLAKEFWEMLMEFTGGDMSLLSKLMETKNVSGQDREWEEKQAIANSFLEPALGYYFTSMNYNPLEEGTK